MEEFEFESIIIDNNRNPYVYIGKHANIYYIPEDKLLCTRSCNNCKEYNFWAPWNLLKPILESEDSGSVKVLEESIEKKCLKKDFMSGFEKYYEKHRKK